MPKSALNTEYKRFVLMEIKVKLFLPDLLDKLVDRNEDIKNQRNNVNVSSDDPNIQDGNAQNLTTILIFPTNYNDNFGQLQRHQV